MYKPVYPEDVFLSRLCQSKTNVTVFLMNGFQMHGTIVRYDKHIVVLMSDKTQQVIYKHAISTIVPERPVSLAPFTSETHSGPND